MTIALISTKTKHSCQDTEAVNLTHIGFPHEVYTIHKFSTNRKRTFTKSGPKVHFHHKMESKQGQSWYQTHSLTQTAVEATVPVLYNSTTKQTWPTQPWPWTSLQLASLQYRQTKKPTKQGVCYCPRWWDALDLLNLGNPTTISKDKSRPTTELNNHFPYFFITVRSMHDAPNSRPLW
jgi:hypothetical protein